MVGISLHDGLMRTFGMGRVFKENTGRINSLDFHRREDLLVTAGEDDSVHLYNINSGTVEKTVYSRKYGVSHIRFTHHPQSVVYASNKGSDHALRYLSLHDNQYVRYFRGHTARVTAVAMSPKNDLFMSASEDHSVRLWDLRSTQCQGLVNCPGPATAAFDQQGLVFCIGSDSGVLKLYDVRSYDKGPFDTFTVPELANGALHFSSVTFSPDGKLMSAAASSTLYLLDAFNGNVTLRLSTGAPSDSSGYEASFSPDGQYVCSGCEDRAVRVWNTTTGQEVAALTGHAGVPSVLKWAPRRLLLASACNALVMWVPNSAS